MAVRKILNISNDKICKYYIEGNSLAKIAQQAGCSSLTIQKLLVNNNIKIRNKNGKDIIYNKVNESFFDTWSPTMAYILGYIYADGCIRPHKYEMKIKSIDYELLDFVVNALDSNAKISMEKGTRCYVLVVYSKKIVDSLIKIGIVPRKSLASQFPKVPDKYFWDFLRGETDGDGHIYPPRDDYRTSSLGIVGSEYFIKYLKHKLIKKLNMPDYVLSPSGKAFTLNIHGIFAVKALQKMYANNHYALSRKKIMALKSIEHYNRPLFCKKCNKELKFERRSKKYCDKCKITNSRLANAKCYKKRMERKQSNNSPSRR